MDNVNKAAVFAVFVGVFVSFFALFIAVWFVNRNGRKRNYLVRVARKYSVSPLFGQSRLTLLRAQQKPPS
jgi:ATP/ADP translocase